MSIYDANSIARKYGVKAPLSFLRKPDPEPEPTEQERLTRNIGNYYERINAAGETPEKPKNKTNLFIKALLALDKPRNAVWNAAEDVIKGENGVLQGLKEGWTGQERYEGTDLMGDLGIKNKYAKGIGGFAAEAILDPLNLVTSGVGSFAKGALTGTTKTLTKEAAEASAKAALKGATREASEAAARRMMESAGQQVTQQAVESTAKQIMFDNANKVLKQFGGGLDNSFLGNTPENIYKTAVDNMSYKMLENDAKKVGRGLSIGTAKHNINIVSDKAMRQAGATAANALKKVPGVGKVVDGFHTAVNSVFNPKFVNGLSEAEMNVIYNLRRAAYGSKNVADEQIVKRFDKYTKDLSKAGVKTAKEQDKIILQAIEGTYTGTLGSQLQKVVDEMRADFQKWGMKEQDIGALRNFVQDADNYFPHVRNWDGVAKNRRGGVTEKWKLDNPSNMYRKHGATVEDANRVMKFRTSSQTMQEQYINQLYASVGEAPPVHIPSSDEFADFLQRHNMTAADADAFGKGILDGVDNYFETSAVKGWMTRALQHNKIVADKEFIDSVTAAFGERITDNRAIQRMVQEGKDVVVPRSSMQAFMINVSKARTLSSAAGGTFDVDAVVAQLSPNAAAAVKQLIQATPEAFAYIDPNGFAALRDEAMALFGNPHIIEAYALPKGVIQAVNAGSRKQIDAGFKALGAAVDKFYAIWKPTVTGIRPDYHIRNAVGSTLNSMLDVGFRVLRPDIQANAARVWKGAADGTINLGAEKFTVKELREAMLRTHASTNLRISEFTNLGDALKNKYEKNMGGVIRGKKRRILADIGEDIGKAVETDVRAAHFLSNVEIGLEKGMTREQAIQFAGEQVNKFQFDYSELTTVEKELFRRIAPFYTWIRKNAPLQAELFLNDPSKYTLITKAQRNMSEAMGVDTSQMPDWLEAEGAIPISSVGADGRSMMLNTSPPMKDVGLWAEPLKTGIGMLSPLIKAPIEYYTNSQLLTQAPIEQYPGETKNVFGVDMSKKLAYALQQFGVAKNIMDMGTTQTVDGKAVSPYNPNTVLGAGQSVLKGYNPDEAKTDAMYEYNRQLGNQVQRMTDEGKTVYDMDTLAMLAKMTPRQQEMYKKYGVLPPRSISKDTDYSGNYIQKYISANNSAINKRFEKAYKMLDEKKPYEREINALFSAKNGGL